MTEPQTPLGMVSERALALLRPSMRKAMNPADVAFLQMRDRAMAHNDKVLADLPREDWEGRGDELLALYPEPELPQRLGEFLQLPGVVSLVAFVHPHPATAGKKAGGKDRATCAVVVTGHGAGRLLISAGIRPDPDDVSRRGSLRKGGVRWTPAVVLVDELAERDELWLPCPSCKEIAMAVTGGLVRREADTASCTTYRRVAVSTGQLLQYRAGVLVSRGAWRPTGTYGNGPLRRSAAACHSVLQSARSEHPSLPTPAGRTPTAPPGSGSLTTVRRACCAASPPRSTPRGYFLLTSGRSEPRAC